MIALLTFKPTIYAYASYDGVQIYNEQENTVDELSTSTDALEDIATFTDAEDELAETVDEEAIEDVPEYNVSNKYIDIGQRVDYYNPYGNMVYAGSLPSSWDSRTLGCITPVKNQNPYGTCWAFSALAVGEASMISKGIVDDIDLSEGHFAYFAYRNVDDALGNITEDRININSNESYLEIGGNNYYSMFALSSWKGCADETIAPYESVDEDTILDSSLAYQDVAHMQNSYIVSMKNIDDVKSLIMEYGAVSSSLYWSDSYYNYLTNSYYQDVFKASNHGVTIIGWDDNYSMEQFKATCQPASQGAWLIKNSWGDYADYLWISYEDLCLSNEDAFAFVFESADNYDFNYQYDGTLSPAWTSINDGYSVINEYIVEGADKQSINAVAIAINDDNVKYQVQIYKNSPLGDPCAGEPMLSSCQEGITTYAGYYTIELDTPVVVAKGDRFAVCFTLYDMDEADDSVELFVDADLGDEGSVVSFDSTVNPNQSFIAYLGLSIDISDFWSGDMCPRIKAFATDITPALNVSGFDIKENSDEIKVEAKYTSKYLDVKFRWMQYDVDKNTWSVLKEWSSSSTYEWKPQKGNYWIHVEAKDSRGNTSNYTKAYVANKSYSYLTLSGYCVDTSRSDGVQVGVIYDASEEDVQFRWLSYNTATGVWELVSGWSKGNWVFWQPEDSTYWLRCEAKISTGINVDYTEVYVSNNDYKNGYINLNGYCIMEKTDSVAIGVAYECNEKNVEFRWLSYNLQTKKWEVISDWTKSNWVTWKPEKGDYWIQVKARTSKGVTATYTQAYGSAQDYKHGYVNLNGYCVIENADSVSVGVVYDSNSKDVQFRWLSYNLQTQAWELVSEWSDSNWVTWKPEKGTYWLRVEAKNATNATADYTSVYESKQDYKHGYINLGGYCIIENEEGISAGVAYDSSSSDVEFRWLAYDLATCQWSVISNWSKSNWMSWKLQTGNYWLHVEARNSTGATASYTQAYNYSYEDEYNYAKLLQYSLYFYDANMCGDKVGETSLCDWRNDCHTFDTTTYTRKDGSTVTVDLTGGFHDAGDHVKFGLPEAYAAFVLGMSYDTNKDAYIQAKQVGHLKNITTHYADYFVDCTVLSADGSKVEAFCCQVGQGGGSNDHGYWGAPENQTNANRPIYFTSASQPSTDIVCLSAAALAIQYKNFGGSEYLLTAKKLFEYARNNNKAVNQTAAGYYNSSSWEDDYCLAAIILYKTTGESQYLDEFNKYASNSNAQKPYWPLGWDNVGPAVAYYNNNSTALSTLMNISNGNSNYGYRCVDDWGSARYNTSMQYTGLLYDKMTGTSTYKSWSEGQMQYILGDNSKNICFVVGYNDKSAKYPHHRAASGYTGGPQGTTTQSNVLMGALVGGPKLDGSYSDSASDYVCNEVAIDYNATLVAASAALYDLYLNDRGQRINSYYYMD